MQANSLIIIYIYIYSVAPVFEFLDFVDFVLFIATKMQNILNIFLYICRLFYLGGKFGVKLNK